MKNKLPQSSFNTHTNIYTGKAEELLDSSLQDKVFDVASANTDKLSIQAVNKIEEVTKLALTEE